MSTPRERILIVEDELPMRTALADALVVQLWEQLGQAMPGPEISQPDQFARAATRAVVDHAVARGAHVGFRKPCVMRRGP